MQIGDAVEFAEDRNGIPFFRKKALKIFLYYIGKARDAHANAMAEEYIKRSDPFREMRDAGDSSAAVRPVGEAPLGDENPARSGGPRRWIRPRSPSMVETGNARDLVFVIGGAEGLPAEWKASARICCWRCRR